MNETELITIGLTTGVCIAGFLYIGGWKYVKEWIEEIKKWWTP